MKTRLYTLLAVLALVLATASRPLYSQAQTLLFGSYNNTAKAVSVDSNGYLNISTAAGSVTEANLSLSNVTTDNVSITAHGFAPILPNDATKFLNGIGTYTTPVAGCAGNCSVTNLLFPASPSTSTTGIVFKGTATAANRFIHNYWDGNVSAADSNTFMGLRSGNFTVAFGDANHNGAGNVGVGTDTLKALTTGGHNVAIGNNAGPALTTGFQNVFIGENAGQFVTTNSGNTCIGKDCMFNGSGTFNTNGNTSVGIGACRDLTTGSCTAMGDHAGTATTTGSVVAIGATTLQANTTTGGNVAIGDAAMAGATQNYSTAIGMSSMTAATGGTGFNTCIGNTSCATFTTDDSMVSVGALSGRSGVTPLTNTITLGMGTTSALSNDTVIGRTTTQTFHLYGVIITGAGTITVANVGANSCGTTAATVVGNDNAGEITVGATSGTQCRVAFPVAVPTRRFCTANSDTTTIAVRTTYVDTTHTDFIGTFPAAEHVTFTCMGF